MCSVVTAPEYCSSCSLQGRSLFQQHSLEQDFKLTITKGTITPGQLNHIARFSQHLSNKDNASLSVEYKTTYRQAQSIQVSKFVFKNSSSFVLSFFFFLFSFFLFIIFSFFLFSFFFFLSAASHTADPRRAVGEAIIRVQKTSRFILKTKRFSELSTVFCDMTPCQLTHSDNSYGAAFCLCCYSPTSKDGGSKVSRKVGNYHQLTPRCTCESLNVHTRTY